MPLELTKEEARRLAIGIATRETRGQESTKAKRQALANHARKFKKVNGFEAATRAVSERRKIRKKLAQDFEDTFRA